MDVIATTLQSERLKSLDVAVKIAVANHFFFLKIDKQSGENYEQVVWFWLLTNIPWLARKRSK